MPVALGKEIAKSWMFKSESGSGIYETLQYVDGSTSCNCKGWTRRVDANGERSCKHTRMVDQGVADMHAASCQRFVKSGKSGTYAGDVLEKKVRPLAPPPANPTSRFKPKEPVQEPPTRFRPKEQKQPEPERPRFKKVELPDDDDLVDADRFKRLS